MTDIQIAEIIRDARITLGYTQQQVAELSNMSFGEYQRIEHGKRSFGKISVEHGLALCKVLELNPYDLL